MKLSTLLLSSAAVLVAGAAYAADLPAKKAAPAAAPTGCPAFGAGFFQIPGGDTCIQFSGYMNYEGSYSSDNDSATAAKYSQGGNFRLKVDVRSNTEMGVVRGFARMNASTSGASISRAYAQLGGLTAGKDASMADIAGTNAWQYGTNLGGGTGQVIKYAFAAGPVTITAGLENAPDNNGSYTTTAADPVAVTPAVKGSNVADRPDVLLAVAGSAGALSYTIVGASHEAVDQTSGAATTQGYAVVARLGVKLDGGFGAAIFGGTSQAASKYTSKAALVDYDGTDKSAGTNFGGELLYSAGPGTLAIAADQSEEKLGASNNKVSNLGVSYVYNVTKNFVVEPEYIIAKTESGSTSSTSNKLWLRISRDF